MERHDLLSPMVLGGLLGTVWRFDGIGVAVGMALAGIVATAIMIMKSRRRSRRWRKSSLYLELRRMQSYRSNQYRLTYSARPGLDGTKGFGAARSK